MLLKWDTILSTTSKEENLKRIKNGLLSKYVEIRNIERKYIIT